MSKNSTKLVVTDEVLSNTDLTYNIQITIENKTSHCLYDINVYEELLTFTNVYFSTLSINNFPVSFQRDILNPLLYTLKKLEPESKIRLTYPVTLYGRVDDVPRNYYSKTKVIAKYNKDKTLVGKAKAFLTQLQPAGPIGPRIGIVGGGLAGLTVAYNLSQAGYSCILYEGSNRLGGRCYSGKFPDGEIYEHGGELIDTDHTDILDLISQLGLTVDNLRGGELPNTQEYYEVMDYDHDPPKYVKYTMIEASYDFFNRFNPATGLTIYQKLYNDANNTYPTNDPTPGPATPWPLTYADPVLAAQLDSITLDKYINDLTGFLRSDGNGAKTKLGQLLKVAYVIEFGAEPCEQSPFNIIYLLGFITLPEGVNPPNIPVDYFYLFGISNETYHTHGGNSRIVERLLEELQLSQVSIYMESRLTKVVHRNDLGGKYQLTFNENGKSVTPAPFDYAVSAIPFSTYVPTDIYHNWGIDIFESDFSDLKKYAIYHLAMSRNCKLNVQFKNRFWRHLGNNGATYATSNPYLTTPCGGDDYHGAAASMKNKHNPVGLAVPPVADPSKHAKGEFERKFQNTWEVSRAQPQHKGILVDYTGGRYAEQFLTSACISNTRQHSEYLTDATCKFLKQLNFLLPGSTENFEFEYDLDGNIVNVDSNNWKQSIWQRGAYSFWQAGQYIGGKGTIVNGKVEPPGSVVPFAGYEGVPEPYNPQQSGNFLFAGEQTSYDNQGYLDGAVESGNRVANALLAVLPPLS
jgi:monoamine oxidase